MSYSCCIIKYVMLKDCFRSELKFKLNTFTYYSIQTPTVQQSGSHFPAFIFLQTFINLSM